VLLNLYYTYTSCRFWVRSPTTSRDLKGRSTVDFLYIKNKKNTRYRSIVMPNQIIYTHTIMGKKIYLFKCTLVPRKPNGCKTWSKKQNKIIIKYRTMVQQNVTWQKYIKSTRNGSSGRLPTISLHIIIIICLASVACCPQFNSYVE